MTTDNVFIKDGKIYRTKTQVVEVCDAPETNTSWPVLETFLNTIPAEDITWVLANLDQADLAAKPTEDHQDLEWMVCCSNYNDIIFRNSRVAALYIWWLLKQERNSISDISLYKTPVNKMYSYEIDKIVKKRLGEQAAEEATK